MKGGEMKTVERIADGQVLVRGHLRGRPDFHHAKGVIERFPAIKLDIVKLQTPELSEVSTGDKILPWAKGTIADVKPLAKAHGVIETEARKTVVEAFAQAKLTPDTIKAAPAVAPRVEAKFAPTFPKLTDFITPIIKAVTAAIPIIFSLLALSAMWNMIKPKPPKFA